LFAAILTLLHSESVSGRHVLRSWRCNSIPSIQAPRDAVKLQVRGDDLHSRCDTKEVETFDLIGSRTDSEEVPVPQNFVAAGNEDFQSGNAQEGWGVQDVVDVGCLAAECDLTELEYVSEFERVLRERFSVQEDPRARGRSRIFLDSCHRVELGQ
jgi:hypothetical protein